MKLITGNVYYLENFTAPKLFNGLFFECLLTDQKISANEKAVKNLGNIKEWRSEIYKPERFILPLPVIKQESIIVAGGLRANDDCGGKGLEHQVIKQESEDNLWLQVLKECDAFFGVHNEGCVARLKKQFSITRKKQITK